MVTHKPGALVIILPPLDHLAFVHEAPDGTLRAWDVTQGNLIARDGRLPLRFSLTDHGVTREWLANQYPGIDWEYARTTDLTRPILAIPFAGNTLLIVDGWHRLAHAVLEEVSCLPMYLLSQEEADRIQWLELPPDAREERT